MMYSDENEIIKKFSLRVRELRGKHGLTQSSLGGKANLEKSVIQRVERGSNLTLKTLVHLANGFNMSLSELLDISEVGEEKKNKKD